MNKPPDATSSRPAEPAMPLKLAIELGPLLLFFAANVVGGIYAATGAFMVATFAALGFAWWRYHKLPVMLLVSAAIVLVFGGLTLYLRDETFIKLKPTIVYLIFAGLLTGGLLMKKPVLELLFGAAFSLTAEGWRKLTWRWAAFFLVMAVVNEAVRRNFSTDIWVSFKAFGFLPLTFLFAVAQVPLMQRYGLSEPGEAATPKDKPKPR
ncbi:MAG: septation protein A [Methyloceanibacter sp.]|jgi:intracellular septation protein|nr:septation protein A [Methyloceanibacter sp.]